MIFIRRMASMSSIKTALQTVNENVQKAAAKRIQGTKEVRLVAVTKIKPVEDILAAYECGHRNFGENYMNELEEKSKDPRILENCKDIRWHFIGLLQSNKVKKLISVPNLYMFETVHSPKIAQALQKEIDKAGKNEKLKVFVQVNTSEEENKSGVAPSEAPNLVSLVLSKCPGLDFTGLMTIGAFNHSMADGENPDFMKLIECRKDVCDKCNLPMDDVELSMGMSNDYEHAIELGSTNIRVGSTIFGARAPPKQSKPGEITENSEQPSRETGSASQNTSQCTDSVDSSVDQLKELQIIN